MFVSMSLASHGSHDNLHQTVERPPREGRRPDLLSFEAWRRADPIIAVFTDLDGLNRYLLGSAALRTPDPVFDAVARMIDADDTNYLAAQVYLDAFAAPLTVLAEALSRHSGRSLATCSRTAREELLAVASEASFRGEAHAGATIMSRTWARSVAALSPRQRSRLMGEIVAAFLRMRTAIESTRETLAGRLRPCRGPTRSARRRRGRQDRDSGWCRNPWGLP
jgi:hypothetical protein